VGPVHGVTDLLAIAATVETPRYVHAPVQDTDLCVLIATGGTTGVLKASRRDWLSYAEMVDLGPASGRRQLICTPLAYVAQVIADAALIGGGQLILRNTFEPSQILHTIQDKRVTHLALVEPLLVQLIDSDRFASTDISSLIAISHVGADAAPSLRARLLERLGRPILVSLYGVSECGIVSLLAAPDYSLQQAERLETSGKVSPGPLSGGRNPTAVDTGWPQRMPRLRRRQSTRPPCKNAWCSSARSGKTPARICRADEPNH
jgi:fatty-acyl-CoA synthase